MNIQILLGEDQPVVVEGLRQYFSDKPIKIAAVFLTLDQVVQSAKSINKCVVVSEIRIAAFDVLAELGRLTESQPFPPIVFFSTHKDQVSVARALAMSASDYVFKSESLQVLEKAIVNASSGIKADSTRPISQRRVQLTATRADFSPAAPLTHRELQVLRHIAMGLSNREISRSLGISVETTKEHVQNILRKLDVNDRTQAAIWGIRNHLV